MVVGDGKGAGNIVDGDAASVFTDRQPSGQPEGDR